MHPVILKCTPSEDRDRQGSRDEAYFRMFDVSYLRHEISNNVVYAQSDQSSPVENQNNLELDFKVFFFADSCCSDIVVDESN